jgi:uncharacterized protein YggE
VPIAETNPGLGAAPTVSVMGEAMLRAEPDEALVIVSLSALKDSPGQALEDVATRSLALAALLGEQQITATIELTFALVI